jgi:hypothetical protein
MNPLCPEDQPCHATCIGAALLTCWLYVSAFPQVFLGESFGAALGKVLAGDVLNLTGLWVALLVAGIAALGTGLRAALSHDDPVKVGRVVWSGVGVAFCLWAVSNQLYVTDTAFSWHLSRALWLSVMASFAADIWLQTRGLFSRLAGRRGHSVPAPVPQQSYPVPVSIAACGVACVERNGATGPRISGRRKLAKKPNGRGRQGPSITFRSRKIPRGCRNIRPMPRASGRKFRISGKAAMSFRCLVNGKDFYHVNNSNASRRPRAARRNRRGAGGAFAIASAAFARGSEASAKSPGRGL